MILYKGQLRENSCQDDLIHSLKDDLYRPIFDGDRLTREVLINACDRLAERVLQGEFDAIVKPFLNAFHIDNNQFAYMAGQFTREHLEYKCSVELCDEERVIDGKVTRRRYPLGVLLHIAAGNVDVLPAYSVIEGLLAGNINVLKLPMGDSGLSVRLLYELIRIEPLLTDYIYVFDVPSTDTENLRALAALCDGVIVWGGDEAVRAARNMVDIDTRIIAWGHKLSFAYAESDASDRQLEELAEGICATDQLLCSSCQGIFVDTDSRAEQRLFAGRFFEILKSVNRRFPQVDFGIRAKCAINGYNERLEQHLTGNEILCEDGVSVILREDQELDLSYLYRNVWVKRLPHDQLYTLKRYKNHLQTAAVLTTDAPMRQKICDLLAAVGVVRITSGAHMSRMICGGAHDGTYALREYTRIVETDLF